VFSAYRAREAAARAEIARREAELRALAAARRGAGPPAEAVIVVCAAGNLEEHLADRRKHDSLHPDGRLTVFAMREPMGALTHDREANRAAYRAAARRVAEVPEPRVAILDIDARVPYEHVTGIIAACRGAGIDDIRLSTARTVTLAEEKK
jgi:hypothetical protein